jgi:hypothetical protein
MTAKPTYGLPRIGDQIPVVLDEFGNREITGTVEQLAPRKGRAGVVLDLGLHGQRWLSFSFLTAVRVDRT